MILSMVSNCRRVRSDGSMTCKVINLESEIVAFLQTTSNFCVCFPIATTDLEFCPTCGGHIRRMITSANFVLKGE